MWALSELGLDRKADERDVKRAYARRVKTVRPDENPQDFQRLHESYEAALAFVRRAPEERDDEPEVEPYDEREHAQPEPSAAEPRPDATSGAAGGEIEAVPEPEQGGSAGTFYFDLDVFLEGLVPRAADADTTALRRWLEEVSTDWPFALKPMIADDVLAAILASDRAMPAANLKAVVETFGFDDVLTVANPANLTALHQRMADQDKRERVLTFVHLLSRENRPGLVDRMRDAGRGGYDAAVTRFMAFVLTNPVSTPFAYVAQYIPFLRGAIVRFLYALDGGRTDALTPAIALRTLDTWTSTKEQLGTGDLWWRTTQVLGFVFFVTYTAISVATEPDTTVGGLSASSSPIFSEERTREKGADLLLSRGTALNREKKFVEAREVFQQLIDQTPEPWTPRMQELVSSAYFKRAYAFDQGGRTIEARETYEELYRKFADSDEGIAQMTVASGMVNKAWSYLEDRDYRQSYDTYARVLDRYGRASNPRTDRQVAKSLYGQMRCLQRMDRQPEAIALGNRTIGRFSNSSDAAILETVSYVRDLMDEMK